MRTRERKDGRKERRKEMKEIASRYIGDDTSIPPDHTAVQGCQGKGCGLVSFISLVTVSDAI